MPKFFVENKCVKGDVITITQDYKHIKNVLRKNVGDKIEVCNYNTEENFLCEISSILDNVIYCKILKKIDKDTESNIKISIFQALPKHEKMELIIQKSVELGAYEITPVEMKNCVVKLNEKEKIKKIQRWQKISESAAKQSGRNIIPKINNIINIKQLNNIINEFDSVIVTYENEEKYTLKEELENIKKIPNKEKIAIVIGPEGGIDNQEIISLKENGAKIVTLGKRILRTETVAIALTSILMFELK